MPFQHYNRSLEALALVFPLSFRFSCLGVAFDAKAAIEDDACRLTIEADLGPVPFTAESAQARTLRLALFNLTPSVAQDCRFVERQHRLFLVTSTLLETNPPARRLVAAAIAQVMRCRPELALAAETGVVTGRRAVSRPPVQDPEQSQTPAATAEPDLQASAA